jgi:hypothetical protein
LTTKARHKRAHYAHLEDLTSVFVDCVISAWPDDPVS